MLSAEKSLFSRAIPFSRFSVQLFRDLLVFRFDRGMYDNTFLFLPVLDRGSPGGRRVSGELDQWKTSW